MPEPKQLKRGKIFQIIVQNDYKKNNKGGIFKDEAVITLKELKNGKKKGGRIDILIDIENSEDDLVTVIEIKATDWDKIKPKNIKKNLHSHQRQLYKYVEKFLDVDNLSVTPAIIYPKPPKDDNLRKLIEEYLENYGAPAYWYTEIKTEEE